MSRLGIAKQQMRLNHANGVLMIVTYGIKKAKKQSENKSSSGVSEAHASID